MAKVYFLDLHSTPERNILNKLESALGEACSEVTIRKGDMVAVKTHFGERGNLAFIRHQYLRKVVDFVKSLGGDPFLTDTNTLYVGTRSRATDHIATAFHNGFGPLSTGAPLIIADGLRGDSKAHVKIKGELVKDAVIGLEVYNADTLFAVTHFKGHELTGFGGAIKNLGMGCAAREGKLFQHSTVSPYVDLSSCVACGKCAAHCPGGAISISTRGAVIDQSPCIGCADCIVICPENTIHVDWNEASVSVMRKMAEYALAAIVGKEEKTLLVNFITQVSPLCDCYGFNDVPIAPDVGICLSTDPLALDQASVDLVTRACGDEDPFRKTHPHIDWSIQLEHGEKIGLGSRKYELVTIP